MSRRKTTAKRRSGPRIYFPPVTIRSAAAAKSTVRRPRKPEDYPKRFDDIRHLFLPRKEYRRVRASLAANAVRGGDR